MKKKIVAISVLVMMLFTCLPMQAQSEMKAANTDVKNSHDFDLISNQAILIDLTDQKILYQKNPDERIQPASMTKIMTVLVAIENIKDLDQTMVLGYDVFEGLLEADASVAGFKQGEEVSMRDLLYASYVMSGADASKALAIHISGSETAYVELMNKKAQALSMKDTHFVNTTGLDDDQHYSTVRNIATLLEAALKNKTFSKIYEDRKYELPANVVRSEPITMYGTLLTHIKRLGYEDNVIEGGKTGYTEGGGLCLASTAKHGGTRYLAVSANGGLDAQTSGNVIDAYEMYQYYFENYERKVLLKKGEEYLNLPVKWNFSNDHITFVAKQKMETLVPVNIKKSDIKITFIGASEIETPIKDKQLLGQLEFVYGNELLLSIEVRAAEDIGRNPILYYGEPIIIYFQNHALAMVLLIAVGFSLVVYIIWRKKYRRYL